MLYSIPSSEKYDLKGKSIVTKRVKKACLENFSPHEFILQLFLHNHQIHSCSISEGSTKSKDFLESFICANHNSVFVIRLLSKNSRFFFESKTSFIGSVFQKLALHYFFNWVYGITICLVTNTYFFALAYIFEETSRKDVWNNCNVNFY